MKKLFTTAFLCLLLLTKNMYAQTYTLDKIDYKLLKSTGTIIEKNVIKGYFMLYLSDKVNKDLNTYEMVILNTDLEEKVSTSITAPKRTILLESSYNGEVVMLKFYDSKSKTITYQSVNKDGKLSEKTDREVNKFEIAIATSNGGDNDIQNNSLQNINESLFANVFTTKESEYTYKVEGVNNSSEILWTFMPENRKGILTGAFLASGGNQILITEYEKRNLLSNDIKCGLLALNLKGEMLYNIDLENNEYTLLPHNAFVSDDKSTIIGEYFEKGGKTNKEESLGIFVKKIDENGKDITIKYISWNEDIGDKVDPIQKKEVSKYNVFFHNMKITAEGNIIAIGEQYRKQISAMGTAFKVLGDPSQSSAFEMKIGNMFIIVIDNESVLKSVDILQKKPNKFLLPGGGGGLTNQNLLAKQIKANGGFDYEFSQINDNNTAVSVAYVDAEKVESKRKMVLNIATYKEGESELSKNKVIYDTEGMYMRLLPAKPGFVLKYEYFKKKKQVVYSLIEFEKN